VVCKPQKRMYNLKSRVRYSECDENLELTLTALVNYFQDTSTFQSESLDIGMAYLKEKKVAWVLSYWHIVIDKRPALGEEISISTWPYELSGFMAHRNFVMKDTNEKVIAYANSLWSFVDVELGKIKRIDSKQKELYKKSDPYPMEAIDRKIEVKGCFTKKESFQVQSFFIDSNGHVNNEKYIQMAAHYLNPSAQIKELRVEYKNQAKLGDKIYPCIRTEKNKCLVVLKNEQEDVYATVEFLTK